MRPRALPDRYALLGYPAGAEPLVDLTGEQFGCVLVDPYETTLIVRAELLATLPEPATALTDRRVIVLERELAHDLTGFMSAIAAALAEREIWLLALGAASRDHLLVADDRLEDALGALAALAERASTAP